MVPALLLLTLLGCLEKVTGEDVPLDSRFTAGHAGDGTGADGGGGGGAGAGPGAECDPYADYKGDKLKVTGTITSEQNIQIQIDVAVPDATAPGGQKRTGCVRMPIPGKFEFNVPADVTELDLQAFQDPDGNGPSEMDPFAAGVIHISGADPEPLALALIVGQRGKPNGPDNAPPEGGGSPSATPAAPGAPGGSATAAVFPDGPMITVSGTVQATLPGDISLDFFKHDEGSAGGRSFLFKQQVKTGSWSAKFPKDYGRIEIDAYQDPKGDGPTEGDPICHYEKNPITLGSEDLSGVALLIL